jgi:hypothetical protein
MYKATELINFFLGLAIILFMPECLRAQSVLDLYAANKTVTYQECHDFYKQLKSDKIRVSAINLTHQKKKKLGCSSITIFIPVSLQG